LLDSDSPAFGGSGYSQQNETDAWQEEFRDFPARIRIDIPPLAMTVWAGPQ
jgi:hypothetical protein